MHETGDYARSGMQNEHKKSPPRSEPERAKEEEKENDQWINPA